MSDSGIWVPAGPVTIALRPSGFTDEPVKALFMA